MKDSKGHFQLSALRGEEEDDTEPDLDAIASFADDQPDLPNAGSAQAESTVEQGRKSVESSPTHKMSTLTV